MSRVDYAQLRRAKFPQGDFNDAMNHKDDLLDFLVPERLAVGSTRSVYSLHNQRDVALKCVIQHEGSIVGGLRSNIMEFDVWCFVKDHPQLARWFAPVIDMDSTGKFLRMAKCEPISSWDEIPEYIPKFLSDPHYGNWGRLDGQLVCLDYGQIHWDELIAAKRTGKIRMQHKNLMYGYQGLRTESKLEDFEEVE